MSDLARWRETREAAWSSAGKSLSMLKAKYLAVTANKTVLMDVGKIRSIERMKRETEAFMPTLVKPEPAERSIPANSGNHGSKYRQVNGACPGRRKPTTLSCLSKSVALSLVVGVAIWTSEYGFLLLHEEAGLPLSAALTLGVAAAIIAFIASFIYFSRNANGV